MAPDPTALKALRAFAEGQRTAGVEAAEVPGDGLRALEPHLAAGLAGGFHYPQDSQVQPARAAARLLAASGAAVHLGEEVTDVLRTPSGAVRGVRTPAATSPPPPSSTRPGPGAARSPRSPARSFPYGPGAASSW